MDKKNFSKTNSANRVCWTIKNSDNAIIDNESKVVLIILEKIKEKRLKFSHGSTTVLQKMVSY